MIAAWLDASGLPPNWVVSIVGRNGLVVAHSGDTDSYVGRGTASDRFGTPDDPQGWKGEELDGGGLTGVFDRLASGWIVAVGAPDALLSRPIRMAVVRLAVSGFVLVAGGLILSALLTRRIDRSAAALERAARALGVGDLPQARPLQVSDLAYVQDALVGAGRDLAARRVTERTLLADVRSGRDLLQGLIDGSDDLIFARDLDGRVLLANRASAVFVGLGSGTELVGRRVDGLPQPASAAGAERAAPAESGGDDDRGPYLRGRAGRRCATWTAAASAASRSRGRSPNASRPRRGCSGSRRTWRAPDG